MANWIEACATDDLDDDDVRRFDHDGRTYAIYRNNVDEFFCSAGLCSHEAVHLVDGLVADNIIECPKHSGLFDIRTGEAVGAPACIDLRIYPVKTEGGKVLIDLS